MNTPAYHIHVIAPKEVSGHSDEGRADERYILVRNHSKRLDRMNIQVDDGSDGRPVRLDIAVYPPALADLFPPNPDLTLEKRRIRVRQCQTTCMYYYAVALTQPHSHREKMMGALPLDLARFVMAFDIISYSDRRFVSPLVRLEDIVAPLTSERVLLQDIIVRD